MPQDDGRLPRGIDDQGDAKRTEKQLRVFADDTREQVVLGYRRQLTIVPLQDFNLPEEPLLVASLKGPRQLLVGGQYKLEVAIPDSRIDLSYTTLPADCAVEESHLTWTPSGNQVGKEKMGVALRCDGIVTSCEFEFTVEYPKITLPFRPGEFEITPDRSRIVLWEQNVPPSLRVAYRRFGKPGPNDRIALVDLSTGKVLAERLRRHPSSS